VVDLHRGETLLGREESCSICLDDEQVSRRHAKIRVDSGSATLVDLDSRNGTKLNGQKVTDPTPLSDGDLISIGRQEMTIKVIERKPAFKRRGTLDGVASGKREVRPTLTSMGPGAQVTAETDLLRKALQMGRWQEVERLLKARVARLLRSDMRLPPDDPSTRLTIDGILRLAQHTMDPVWLDRLFKLYAVLGWWMEKDVEQRASRLFRAMGQLKGSGILEYIESWRRRSSEISLDGQRSLDRLKELVRMVSASHSSV
jgi:hypothetical protein